MEFNLTTEQNLSVCWALFIYLGFDKIWKGGNSRSLYLSDSDKVQGSGLALTLCLLL